MRICPKCGSEDTGRERRLDGDTVCNVCHYRTSSTQWDKEQYQAELEAGISSRLRGNPLEIEARYFAMEAKIKELEDHIDNLEWVINDNTDTMNELRLHYGEEKHRSEQFELKILNLDKIIERLRKRPITSEELAADFEFLEKRFPDKNRNKE